MSRVLVNSLNVRAGPSTSTQKVAHYDAGQVINSGDLIIQNEGKYWLRYTGGSGNKRYVCMWDNGNFYVDVPSHVPGPRPNPIPIPIPANNVIEGYELTAYCHCSQCCGKSDRITASGHRLNESDHLQVCAAPKNFPFGTIIHISGGWNGTVRVVDRGGAINGKRLDIYCRSHQEALQFGRKKNCTIKY